MNSEAKAKTCKFRAHTNKQLSGRKENLNCTARRGKKRNPNEREHIYEQDSGSSKHSGGQQPSRARPGQPSRPHNREGNEF